MAIEMQNSGMPWTNSRVPSRGSTTQTRCFVEARGIVGCFFGEPAFAVAEQVLFEHLVDGAVGCGDGIMSGFVFGLNCARSESVKDFAAGFEGGVDSLQSFFR